MISVEVRCVYLDYKRKLKGNHIYSDFVVENSASNGIR